jgi:origin recognition complex subunit 2
VEDVAPVQEFEQFFDRQARRHHLKTSDTTLADLNLPHLELKEYHEVLAKLPQKHAAEKKQLVRHYTRFFDQWLFELLAGFNLMFYGLGEKRQLLQEFVERQCVTSSDHLIVVNGVFPGLSIRDLLTRIQQEVMDDEDEDADEESREIQSTGVVGTAERIAKYFSQGPARLFLVVHTLDGPPLRNIITQQVLSVLAQAKYIHLIASIDHLNAGILWDETVSSRFAFVYHDLTTFQYHDTEWLLSAIGNSASTVLGFLNVEGFVKGGKAQRAGSAADIRGLLFELRSLTRNAQEIFRLMVEHQLSQSAPNASDNENAPREADLGWTYHQFYQASYERFLTASDLNFRTQLTEFKDHDMIRSRINDDGHEQFSIPLSSQGLTTLLDEWD